MRNRYNNDNSYVAGFAVVLFFFCIGLAIFGYIWNIVEIAQASSMTGMVILRVVGIFIPVAGAILGFL